MPLSFNIGGKVVDFGPEEFATIIGLKIKGNIDLLDESKFHQEVFNGKGQITFLEFEMKFDELCWKDGERDKAFKLGFLFVVYDIFLIKERTSKYLDLRYMHVVDDLKAFMSYPWGIVCYEYLIMETHNAKMKLFDKMDDYSGMLSINAHGFTTVLQCWVYEVLPKLDSKYSIKVSNDSIPRIHHWHVPSSKIDNDILNSFFMPSNLELIPFGVSENKKLKLQVLGVDEYVKSLVSPTSRFRPKVWKRKLSFNYVSNERSVSPFLLQRSSRLDSETSPATLNVRSSSDHTSEASCS